MTTPYTVIIRLLDVLTTILIVVGGLLIWVATGCFVYILVDAVRVATGLIETIAMSAMAAGFIVLVVPPFIAFGYFIIYMGIKATFQKV
jgi:hypothetical protein